MYTTKFNAGICGILIIPNILWIWNYGNEFDYIQQDYSCYPRSIYIIVYIDIKELFFFDLHFRETEFPETKMKKNFWEKVKIYGYEFWAVTYMS